MHRTARLSFRFAFLLSLLILPLAVETSIHEQTELPKRMYAALVGWALAALWVIGSSLRRDDAAETESTPWRSPTFVLLVTFVAWNGVCAVFAEHPERVVEPLLLEIDSVLWFVLAWCAAGAAWCRAWTLAALVFAASTAAIIGLFQYAITQPEAFPFGIEALSRFAERVAAGEVWRAFPQVEQTDVPGSVFGHANVAAEFVAAALPLAAVLGLAVVATRRGAARVAGVIPAVVLVAVAGLLALFVVRAGSRAALLAVIAAGAVVWLHYVLDSLLRRPMFSSRAVHALVHVLAVVTVVAVGTLALDSLEVSPRHGQHATTALRRLQSSLSGRNTTVRERLDLWANTLEMIRDNPVTGVGGGGFAVAYPRYAASSRHHESGRYSVRRQPEKPHNEVVHVAAETGWTGAGLWLAAVATALLTAGSGLLRSRLTRADRLVVLACAASMVAILAVAMVAFPFRQTATRITFWVLAGVMLRTSTRRLDPAALPSLTRTAILAGAFAVAFAVTLSHYRARWEASRAVRSYGQLVVMEGMLGDMGSRVLVEQLRTLDRAVARVPFSYHYELMRGQALRRMNRPQEAVESFRRCLELHPDLINAHIGLAESLIAIGEVEDARVSARAAVALNPRESRAHMILGRVHQHRGRLDRALRDYSRALELGPSTPDRLQIHLNVAAIQNDRDPVLAARNLQLAASLAPGDARVIEAQARFLERQSPGSQQAFDAWTALLRVAPNHVDAKLYVARSFLGSRQFAAALSLLDEAWSARPDLTTLYDRARALAGLGRLLDARDSLRECMNRCVRQGDMTLWTRCRELLLPIEEGLAAYEEKEDGTDE